MRITTIVPLMYLSASLAQQPLLMSGIAVLPIKPTTQACALLISTASGNAGDYWDFSQTVSQKIENAGTITICKIRVYLDTSPGNADVSWALYSQNNKGGSNYGITTTGSGNGWFDLTFSSNPTVTGDFYLTFESSTNSGLRWRSDTTGIYDSTTYSVNYGTNVYDSQDLMFEIFTVQ